MRILGADGKPLDAIAARVAAAKARMLRSLDCALFFPDEPTGIVLTDKRGNYDRKSSPKEFLGLSQWVP